MPRVKEQTKEEWYKDKDSLSPKQLAEYEKTKGQQEVGFAGLTPYEEAFVLYEGEVLINIVFDMDRYEDTDYGFGETERYYAMTEIQYFNPFDRTIYLRLEHPELVKLDRDMEPGTQYTYLVPPTQTVTIDGFEIQSTQIFEQT